MIRILNHLYDIFNELESEEITFEQFYTKAFS